MSQIDPREEVETFWTNVYLRGQMLFDPDGVTSAGDYLQPDTDVPASRAYVIAPDQTIALAHFGHNPDVIINTIYGLLGEIPLPGDFDNDSDVDLDDFDAFTLCFGASGGAPEPACLPGDFDEDDDIDCYDWYRFFEAWTDPGDPPAYAQCSQMIDLSVSRTDLSWTAVDGATGYDVVEGDLQALVGSGGAFDAAVDQCLADDSAATSIPHTGVPVAGQGIWFVVRGVSGATDMTYDCPGPSLIGSRDVGIDASSSACP